jgi:hypothetical protein
VAPIGGNDRIVDLVRGQRGEQSQARSSGFGL